MEQLKLNLYFHDFASFSGLCLVSKLSVVSALLILSGHMIMGTSKVGEELVIKMGHVEFGTSY